MWPFVKRIIDIIVSSVFILILLPIFIIESLLILFADGRPVFFLQERVGKNWKLFKIFKYRTMYKGSEHSGDTISTANDSRVIKYGHFLRKWKLDEIPQFFNVLIGNMSIVGSRPEVYKYVNMFRADFDSILTLKPGITDYASIEFRNEESILENEPDKEAAFVNNIIPGRIRLYKKYLNDTSFFVDIKIMIKTFFVILKG